MEWLQKMNEALDYLEEHLEGDPDLEQAARRAGCSGYHFQRIFSYLAGMPLGEYLRRRKMTRAALDLQGGAKVLDTALRYGYDSPTAFSRAFQKLHGVSPSAARRPWSSTYSRSQKAAARFRSCRAASTPTPRERTVSSRLS